MAINYVTACELYEDLIHELLELIEVPFDIDVIHNAWWMCDSFFSGSHSPADNSIEYYINIGEQWDEQDIYISSMNLDKFHSTIPNFVSCLYHEVGHAVDNVNNFTGFAGFGDWRKRAWRKACSNCPIKEKAWYLYRMGCHEKFADLFAIDIYEQYFDEILEILERYEKQGLEHLFD